MRKLLIAVKAVVAVTAAFLLTVCVLNVVADRQPQGRTYQVDETAAVGSLGLADSWLWFLSPPDVDHQLDLMVNTGVHSARIMFPWAAIQPAPDAWDWGQADHIVNAANARGIAVVALLNSTPGWATGGGPAITAPPLTPESYAAFAGGFASHFAGRVAAYEMWNEQNAAQFWAGPQGPQPDRYAAMLKATYPAIKGADPGATVVAGGLAPTINFFSITMDPVTFLDGLYAAGAGGSFDALAFHPYLFTPDAKVRFSTAGPNSPRGLYDAIRQRMNANGDGGKRLWATEFGESTATVSEADQADRIRDFIVAWRGLPGSGPVFIYTTRDRATGSPDPQDNYGVYRTDWTAKPAADVIRSLA